MGRAKSEMMAHEDKVNQAVSLCIEIGAIEECDVHSGTYLDSMEHFDYSELAEKIIDDIPDALEGFEDKAEFVICVEEAMGLAGEECGSCAKYRDS